MGRGDNSATQILYGEDFARSESTLVRLTSDDADGLDVEKVVQALSKDGIGALRFDWKEHRCLCNTITAVYWTVRDGGDSEQWQRNIIRGGGVPDAQEEKRAKQIGELFAHADNANKGAIEDFHGEVCVVKFNGSKKTREKQKASLTEALTAATEAGMKISEATTGESLSKTLLEEWFSDK